MIERAIGAHVANLSAIVAGLDKGEQDLLSALLAWLLATQDRKA
ncbi:MULTISPECIES: hypothetical protein [unclassified Sphingomonas]|nr:MULTISPECIES: hypothetical protein [unclassified Sphingomonas]